jgi:uncharacterized protein YneF (UPF0154 family)
MGKIATNLVVILGLITVVFAGYYIYTKQFSGAFNFDSNDQAVQDMLKNTQAFIGYGNTLREVKLELDFFASEEFRSLRTYSTPIQERDMGRSDPFAEPVVSSAALPN